MKLDDFVEVCSGVQMLHNKAKALKKTFLFETIAFLQAGVCVFQL